MTLWAISHLGSTGLNMKGWKTLIIRVTNLGRFTHPFGTIKSWMESTHFLTKQLQNVSTEMSLHVLAYNLRRMMLILGPSNLIAAMRA
jgi:hypothetical protein